MLIVKGCPEMVLFKEWLNKFFTVCNSGNTLPMTINFFFKMSKFDVRSKNETKNLEKLFSFLR